MVTILGTPGNDGNLNGTSLADTIWGFAGETTRCSAGRTMINLLVVAAPTFSCHPRACMAGN